MTTQRAKLFASIMLAAVCALCAQPLQAEQRIPVEGSYAWTTWHSTYRFDPKFSSMSWSIFRDEVLFPIPHNSALLKVKGDEPYRHLEPGEFVVFPDLGDASKAEADRLRGENKTLTEKTIPELKRERDEALAKLKIVPWYRSAGAIAAFVLAGTALGFVIGIRRNSHEPTIVNASKLVVDSRDYDVADIRVLVNDNRNLDEKGKRLERENAYLREFAETHGFVLFLNGTDFKRVTNDFDYIILPRDPAHPDRVYVDPPNRPVDGDREHVLHGLDGLDDGVLIRRYNIQKDTAETRRFSRV